MGAAALGILTITHARIRVEQGDTDGARRVLRALLERQPDHEQARAMLASLAGAPAEVPRVAVEARLEEPQRAQARELAGTFRLALGRDRRRTGSIERRRRLERWLDRIRATGRQPHRAP